MRLTDHFGRTVNYLRLSITDRCNLRCCYCMPAEGVAKLEHDDVLSYEQLLEIARAAVDCGVEKIRITGGEPLVRKGVLDFLKRLKQLPGLKKLVLTTNGIFLEEMAADIRKAGVESINISLDSLKPEVYSLITRGGDLGRVLRGIEAANSAGFPYLKINMVVMRGVNDAEVADFAAMTLDRPFKVRFIEFMPTLKAATVESMTVPGEEILERLSKNYRLQKLEKESMDGPSINYRIEGGLGTIGFINPISCHFCHECNRIRVTSTGFVKSCLFNQDVLDLKPLLAAGKRPALYEALLRTVMSKNLRAEKTRQSAFNMSRIGG